MIKQAKRFFRFIFRILTLPFRYFFRRRIIATVLTFAMLGGSGTGCGLFDRLEFPEDFSLSSSLSNAVSSIANGLPGDRTSSSPAVETELSHEAAALVHIIDVGQGLSVLVTSGSDAFLIDAGDFDNGNRVVNTLKSFAVDKLNCLVVSHPHADHFGGVQSVLKYAACDKVIMPQVPEALIPADNGFEYTLKDIERSGAEIVTAKHGDKYTIGKTTVTLLQVESNYEDLNDYSVVCKIECGASSVLVEADAEATAEAMILNSGADVDSEILVVGHHGASSSSSKAFLASVSPDAAIISCGAGNEFGHPHDAALKRLNNIGAEIYRTDINGTITVNMFDESCSIYPEH